jgi:16S rRNA (uracil1498-N3)-methyltransferase
VSDRCYCSDPPIQGLLYLKNEEAKHLIRVRRFNIGDRVEVFDGRGGRYQTEIQSTSKDGVRLAVLSGPAFEPRARCQLTLATAVPKGERFDWLVEKATEIGVDRVVPLISERSVVDPRVSKLDRLRRLIIEAAKQSGRDRLMGLVCTEQFGELIQSAQSDVRLVAHPGGLDPDRWPSGASVTLAIGPEGGFADAEITAAEQSGWTVIGLGHNRLRVETAGIVASSLILNSKGALIS